MQFSLERNSLLKALSKAQSVIERKNTMAILSNVKIQCDEDSVTITATDMDISLQEVISVQESFEQSSTTIPAHTLYEIVRKLPDGSQINFKSFDTENGQMEISSGLSRFALPCLSASGFPNFEATASISEFNIDSQILKTLLNKTKHAVSYEETRYYLTGIYLYIAESGGVNMLRAIATDTHRLAQAEAILPAGAENMPGIIVPRKTVFELIRILEGSTGDVRVKISNNKATFVLGATTFTSKLVDAKFPDCSSVIPDNHSKHLEASRQDLSRAIDLVTSVSADKTRAVRLTMEDSKLTISANSEANGNAFGSEVLDVQYSHETAKFYFNAKYLLDALSAIDSDKVRFSIGDEGSAVIVQDPDDTSCIHILMPIEG